MIALLVSILLYESRTVVATAYTPDPSENGGLTISMTGKRLKHGIIAVDPEYIPIHSRIYVPPIRIKTKRGYVVIRYGWGVAEDTGGRIKGNRIDLCDPSRHWNLLFGRRKINIKILRFHGNNK